MRMPAKEIIPDPLSIHSLYLLTLSLCLSLSPHIARIPVWLSVAAISAVLYMLASLYWKLPRVRTWVLWLLVSMCLITVTAHYGKLFGRDSGVSLLVIMLSLKLLETRRRRDGMVMVGLIYFNVMTHFLYDQTIPLFFFMLCAVAVNTLALITLNETGVPMAPARKIRMVGVLLLNAFPIMLVLFVLFPRIPGPIWGLPQDAFSARTGLSESMSPNDISNVVLSDEPAFRVVFTGPTPRPEQLYWRTLIFGNFDGRTWRADEPLMAEPERLMIAGESLSYTVTVEPHQRRWLFALDMPVLENPATLLNGERLHLTSERLLRTTKPVLNLAQYSVVSYPRYRLGSDLTRHHRQRSLQIPAGSNPRSLELARSWRNRTQQPRELVAYALDLFRRDFTYTLKPPSLGYRHPVDEFLFESKRGFCEHFAGSFVFLMRAAGIPARVVTGYQGGEFNPLDDYLLVRQSDAHAWAEVWLDEQGWTRIDPTTAVSPARIELGFDEAIPLSERAGFFYSRNYPFINRLRQLRDALDNRWNHWILGYGQETQLGFLSKLGLRNPDPYSMTLTMLLGIMLVLAVTGLLSLKRGQQPDEPLQKIYLRLCARLSRMGYARRAYEGPRDFATRIKAQDPALGELLEPVFSLYARLRYGNHHVPHAALLLQRKVKTLGRLIKKPGSAARN